jgi:hypothetical protein
MTVAPPAIKNALSNLETQMSGPAICIRWLFAAALLLPAFAAAQEARPAHPLDALTGAEIHQVKEILKAAGKLGPNMHFHAVDLVEPDKATVMAWKPGMTWPRRAIAVVSENGEAHEAGIDLSANRMTTWQAITGEPALLLGEVTGATGLALADPRMVEGLAKRGFGPRPGILPAADRREFRTARGAGPAPDQGAVLCQAGRIELLGPPDRGIVRHHRPEIRQGA